MRLTPNTHIKTAYDNHGNSVSFYEKEHKYLLNNDPSKRMTSVTTLINRCFPEFNGPEVAKKNSAKKGKTPEALLEEWRLEGVEGSRLGTLVHTFAENILKANDIDVNQEDGLSEKDLSFLSSLKDFIPKLLARADFIESEKIVFDSERMIAGTIDVLMRAKSSNDLILLDWKTNKKIDTENFWQSGLGQMSHLDDCKLNRYSLQLHIYKKIMEDRGYNEMGQNIKVHIVHLLRNEDGSVASKFVPVRDLSREAALILEGSKGSPEIRVKPVS